MEIRLPFIPKSLNELFGMNRFVRAKYTREKKEEIAWLVKASGYKAEKVPVDVVYTIVKKDKRKGDSDNWNAKCFTDGLVLGGILPDDNTDYIRRISYELTYGDEDETIIRIIPVTK